MRRPVEHDAGDEAVPEREAVAGRWSLISAMTKADGLDKAGKLSTFNARSETAPKSFTLGNAWRRGQHCIIPADANFEPDWRSGAAVATRFTRADGAPLGIRGLWDRWRDAAGQRRPRRIDLVGLPLLSSGRNARSYRRIDRGMAGKGRGLGIRMDE